MKKMLYSKKNFKKIISIFTSAAMMGSFAGMTALAENANPIGLELVSDKTSFTIDEVRSGNAETVVYVDSTTCFDESEMVTSFQFDLQSDSWGVIDPVNLELCSPNAFSVDNGNRIRYFNTITTTAASLWDEEIPSSRYQITDYNQTVTEYSDDCRPTALLVSDSTTGKIRAEEQNSDCHVAQFDIKIPADIEPGEYKISFVNAVATIGEINDSTDTLTMQEITNLKGITITVEGDESEDTSETDITEETTETEVTEESTETDITEETTETEVTEESTETDITEETTETEVTEESTETDITEETTETEVTEESTETDVPQETTTTVTVTDALNTSTYAGYCKMWVESGINAAVGDKVYVPVYMDTYGLDIQGVAARVVYDESALKLVEMYDPYYLGYEASGLEIPSFATNTDSGIFIIMSLYYNKKLVNNPDLPIVMLEFEVLEGAYGEYAINIENSNTTDKHIEVVFDVGSEGSSNQYLFPMVKAGSVNVGEIHATSVTTTTEETTVTTTTTTTTTTVTTTTTTTTTEITTTVTTTTTAYVPMQGDINVDDTINIVDVVLAQKYLLGIPERVHYKFMDMNNDGKLNIFDLIIIKRIVLEYEVI